jgi:hypothetical protein
VTRCPTTPKQVNTTLNTKVQSNQPYNQRLLLMAIACERFTNWITVHGLISEVLKRIRNVHTLAASSGTNMRTMDLFESKLVSASGHETRISNSRLAVLESVQYECSGKRYYHPKPHHSSRTVSETRFLCTRRYYPTENLTLCTSVGWRRRVAGLIERRPGDCLFGCPDRLRSSRSDSGSRRRI